MYINTYSNVYLIHITNNSVFNIMSRILTQGDQESYLSIILFHRFIRDLKVYVIMELDRCYVLSILLSIISEDIVLFADLITQIWTISK